MRALLIDGSAVAYQTVLGAPRQTRPSDDANVGAPVLFASRLAKYLSAVRPTHAVVAFDSGDTFRRVMSSGYKASRGAREFDEEQEAAWAMMMHIAQALPVVNGGVYEADDLLATWARRLPKGGTAVVVANDKDMHQIVSDRVTLLSVRGDERVTVDSVRRRWGVPPDRVADVQALSGDGIDSIRGVRGVGPVKARAILAERRLVEALADASSLASASERVTVAAGALDALAAYRLTRLRTDARCPTLPTLPLDTGTRIVAALKALEADAAVKRVSRELRVSSASIQADPKLASKSRPRQGRTLFTV